MQNIKNLGKICIARKSWPFMTRKVVRLINESAFVVLNYIVIYVLGLCYLR